MSRFMLLLPLSILVGGVVMLYVVVTNSTDQRLSSANSPQLGNSSGQSLRPLRLDQHGPDDHHGPQELPRYRASMQNGYFINGRSIEGWNFSAHTKATDAELLAQATEAIYEKLEKKWRGTLWTPPPTIKVIFWHANHTHATGFYIEEKSLVGEVLTKAQLSRATVEGRTYVLSGDVTVKGLEEVIETD